MKRLEKFLRPYRRESILAIQIIRSRVRPYGSGCGSSDY